MRNSPTDMPGRRVRVPANRIWIVVAVVLLIILITSLRGIAGFYTDYLWFKELSFTSVWRGVLGAKALLTIVFMLVFFVAMLASLTIAERLAPRFRMLGPEDEIVQRYRDLVGRHAGKVRIGVSALLALIAGGGVSGQWSSYLMFRHHVSFHAKDAQFHKDLGFFVFQLPFLRFIVDWVFVAIVIITFITAIAHYLNGGIRLPRSPVGERVSSQVKAHLSVLLALLALVKAVGYWLQRYGLATSHRGVVDGPTYTDVHAQLPAINLLIFVSLIAVALFVVNIRRQGWLLPGIAVGLWLFLSVVVGGIYPAFIQRVRVVPAQNAKERPYIARNIAATRKALGIDKVNEVNFNYQENLDASALQRNADTVRNLRLWDPKFTLASFSQNQKLRAYYKMSDLDVDRYILDGKETQVLLSVRDLDPNGLAQSFGSWVNRKLQFTHGFGAVVAPANAVSGGNPNFILKDVPPQGTPAIKQPRVYYGDGVSGWAIVGSKQKELDFQSGDQGSAFTHYSGKGGVPLGSVFRRAAFSLRFGDINPLLSGLLTSKSRVIYVRDVSQRIQKAAPFLHFDSDIYPVVLNDGRLVWVQDGYTTSNAYPYGQEAETGRLESGSGLNINFNYVRNSVKAVVDAYDGNVTLYRTLSDRDDPIAAAWAKAFPKLFTPASRMSEDLKSHLRYPEELFRIQTGMYGRYHITDPNEFFQAGDAWHVAQDPGSGDLNNQTVSTAPVVGAAPTRRPVEGTQGRMDPYYLLTRLPNEQTENFQLLEPFVPASGNGNDQRNMTAFMVAKMDPGVYGRLEVFEMPRNLQVDGPALVDNDIKSDAAVSSALTLLSQSGSRATLGNLIVIPIEHSLLWMRPLYVASTNNSVPELRKVIVSYAGKVAMSDTLQDALTAVFGAAPPTLEQPAGQPGATTPTPNVSLSVQQLLDQALAAYDAAQTALRAGDLATYQAKIDEFHRLAQQARDASAKSSNGSTPPTTAASRSA